jgi:hypothetical protein
MDKVFSTRIDEAAIDEMERITRRLGMTKKKFLEEAIQLQAQRLGAGSGPDVWAETSGAWQRREPPAATVRRARKAFRKAFERRHGSRRK